jgi:hypothetical protein
LKPTTKATNPATTSVKEKAATATLLDVAPFKGVIDTFAKAGNSSFAILIPATWFMELDGVKGVKLNREAAYLGTLFNKDVYDTDLNQIEIRYTRPDGTRGIEVYK